MIEPAFQNWISALENRHLADLTFSELSRALRALSSTYVERRHKIAEGSALSGAGKRAAFALFYGPLHFLVVRHIVQAIAPTSAHDLIIDLGCGTGAAGAASAWAQADPAGQIMPHGVRPAILGIDRNAWALSEASQTYRAFGFSARTRQADVANVRLPPQPATVVAAFTMNELTDADRDALLTRLLERTSRGDSLLIVEPLARRVARWWECWRQECVLAGGRADEWRFAAELPPIVAKLDRAAGLNHRELTGRSLWIDRRAAISASASAPI